jgi:transcriptional regulator with XRE-family HTH domain
MAFNILTLTGEQIRAARALSRIEQTELARLSDLSLETIKRLERIRGAVDANARTLRAIQDAFAAIGVQFDGDDTGRIGVQQHSRRPDDRLAPRSGDAPSAKGLHRIIYHSRIVRGADESLRPTLAYIHKEAQTLYAGLDITGIIFAREGRLLQALEGERDILSQAYRAISCYPQHQDLRLIEDGSASQRLFPESTFCCGLFASDGEHVASAPALGSPFDPDRLAPSSAASVLGIARDLQQMSPRNARGAPGACTLASACLDATCAAPRASTGRLAPQAHRTAPRGRLAPPQG